MGPKNISCPKNILVLKNMYGPKYILGPKNFVPKKNIVSTESKGPIKYGQKIFGTIVPRTNVA